MRNTTNYNLKLPDGPDKYNVQDFNSNAEKIDAELKSHSDAIADRYSKTEVDNKFSMHEMNVDWKESVDTFDDIAITYPNPESGWTVNAKDTNYTYRYDGTSWVAISANAIPKATKELDGIMGKEMVTELERVGQKIDDVKKEEHYTVKEFYTFPENINEITYGNGKYVAVCENNIYTSTDKIKWDITFNTGAKSVAYGNGFIAVGQNGLILTSQNGIDWIDRTDDAMANLSKVIYAGGKFIIVGEGGIIATSDGSAVTKQTSPTDTDLKAVTYGNGKYIAVGNLRGYASVVTSEDGVTWTKITLNALLNRKAIFDIAYGNGNYIILDSTTLYVTGDFTNVIAKRLDDVPTANGVISYIKDRFILSCRYKDYDSKDGIEWIEITKELDCKLSNIDYINSEIIGISTLKKVIKLDTYSMEELKNNVSELNSALDNATKAISKCDLICTIEKLTNNVVKEFPAKWQDYYFISICYGNYGNIFNSILIPSYYLETTTESTRVIVNSNGDNACSIYKKDASTLYARTGNWIDPNGKIRVYGIMKK